MHISSGQIKGLPSGNSESDIILYQNIQDKCFGIVQADRSLTLFRTDFDSAFCKFP